jgi:hypothetical protein
MSDFWTKGKTYMKAPILNDCMQVGLENMVTRKPDVPDKYK